MDWSNELYVRVYKRETDDDLTLSWEAMALWRAMLLKFDRSGVIVTKRDAKGLAALVRIPHEVVARSLPELLEDGRVCVTDDGYIAPNFMAAQESHKSDKLRQKEVRDRRRTDRLSNGHAVTHRDGSSRTVTATTANTSKSRDDRHSELSLAEQNRGCVATRAAVSSRTVTDPDLRYERSERGPDRYYEFRGKDYVREVRRLPDGSHEEIPE